PNLTTFLPVGTPIRLFSPTFVASRAMTCNVYVESSFSTTSPVSLGIGYLLAAKQENSVISYAAAPPQNTAAPTAFVTSPLEPPVFGVPWAATQTRLFPVSAGATVAFGCEINTSQVTTSGDLNHFIMNPFCTVIYNCL